MQQANSDKRVVDTASKQVLSSLTAD